MGSLTVCLRKVGEAPRAADKDAIVARARELRNGGMAIDAAAMQAAQEALQDVRADLKAMAEPKAPRASTHPKTVMGSELLAAVSRRLGGLDPAWLSEFSTRFETGSKDKAGKPIIKWRNPPIPGVGLLFRRGGTQDLQVIAETLEDEGYLEPGAVERDYKAAGEAAKDMIRAALNRRVVERQDNQIDAAQARMDAEREAYYAELDAESAREAEAERAAIMAESGMARMEMQALSDDDLDIDFAPIERQNTPEEVAAGMRAMGFTEQEIADELASRQDARTTAQAGPAEAGPAGPEGAQAAAGAGEAAQGDRAAGADQGLTLSAQTPEDLKAKAQREAAAQKADADEQKRLADKAKADAQRDEFTLTGSDRPADVAAAAGQVGLFDAPAPTSKPAGADNTVFTQSDAEKARELLRKKLRQFNSGVDPEMLQAGITLAGYHIEAGARTFAKFVRAMVEDLGEAVRPYLKSWYAAVSFDPRAQSFAQDMTPVAEVATMDVDAIGKEPSDVPSPDAGVERDRADAADPARAMGDAVPAAGGATAAGAAGRGGRSGSAGRRPANDPGVPAGGTLPAGVAGDQRVPGADRAGLPEEFPAGSGGSERSGDGGERGIPPQHLAAGAVEAAAGASLSADQRAAAQRAADAIPVTPGDAENIRATLPYLLSGQQEDVAKAEARFAQPDGYGMLFTNGTGTGKTFTGLGVIKRFARQGKTDTLIVVPDDKIMADWVDSAKALGLEVTPLSSTKDAGRGIVITTYANLGDNKAVVNRNWDLVVPDEAHSLSQGKDGDATKALHTLRAITHHPRGAYARYEMLHAADIQRLSDLTERINSNVKIMNNPDTMDQMLVSLREENTKLEARQSALVKTLDAARKAVDADVKARQGSTRARVLMLSATPFAYEKSVDLAEGWLFDYKEGYPYDENSTRYNQPNPREYFFMTHFGYRMRVNKLTEPDDPKLDRGLLQRQFNGWLKKRGTLSQRTLDVPADYDRRFVLVESAVGRRIDDALNWVSEKSRQESEANRGAGKGTESTGWASLNSVLTHELYGPEGFRVRRYLLEAIKAKEVISHIREHMAMGRKVVVFHDFNKGGSRNPFALDGVPQSVIDAALGTEGSEGDAARKAQQYNDALAEFNAEFPDLTGGELLADLISPIERFKRDLPGVLLVNGLEKKPDILARYKTFNDDAAGPQVMLVQSSKDAGWSGHDTTGKHQRVLFNLGLPTKPTTAIQQEGRIYRTGQVSDAMQRYLNTGTTWERWAFAQTIAQRAGVAENLAAGESARALRDAFISAFEESDDYRAGHEGEGKGGKARDRFIDTVTTEWDRAKSFYRGTQKKNSRTKAEEGEDYFATPEPVGLKMVQWADLRGGESALEPSGGHGAIARWIPETVKATAIEPSMALRSRMALVFQGDIKPGTFEDHHIVNKYDGVTMNPPFGTAGRTAIDHVAKATQHLNDGGRVVALIPTGPAADAKFEKWLYAQDAKGKPEHPDLHLVADIRLPAVTFERAGTRVMTRIVVIEKGKTAPQMVSRDLTDISSIEELFDRLEDMQIPPRVVAEAPAAAPASSPAGRTDARAQAQAEKEKAQESGADMAARLGLQVVEHVTKNGAGKTLRGVIRTDLKPAQAQEVDAYTFRKDGGQFIRLEHLAEMLRKFPPPGTVAAEERAVYAVNEPAGTDAPLDLFPESLEGLQALPAQPRAGAPGKRRPAAAWDAQPAAGVPAPNTFAEREDPQFPGLYHYSTQLVAVGQRELPVASVKTWQDAASALASLRRYAVEHFDVLVTDKDGKPLAVVGSFKGAQAQASVYPSTLLAEALRIKGAAKAWGVHNHPSGDASLSRADEHLSNTLAQAFGPSTVDWMGIAAIGGDKFSAFDGVRPYYDSLITGPTKATVPVVERTITPGNQDMPKLENPPTARKVAGTIAAGRSGVLFTDVQHRVTAFVPLESAHAKELRKDGRFDRLINAASNAGAGAAVIVNQAEVYDARTLENIASALRLADIRVLDAVDPARGTSLAQQGLEPRGNLPVLSRVPQTDSGAFKRWFGDSKVVDADGKPLVVYHGTTGDFTAFDPGKRGSSTRVSDAKKGFFFAASGKAASEFTWANGEMTGSVMPVYLSIQNPFEVRLPGEWEPGKYDAAIDYAKREGRDGVIIRGATTLGTQGDVFIAFRPEQIKSAIGNRGTFDPADPDIRMKRGTGPGADIATLKPHIDAIAAKLQGLRAPVQVVSTVFDLPGDIVAALRSMNAMGTTRGLRMPDGRVFLVADKLRDQAEAEFVLFHELFGHEGIRALLDEAAYARELTKLKLANPALASEANQWFASYGADQIAARVERGMSEPEARKVVRLLAIEEALSDRAGKNEPLKGWQAFMAAIQKALRAVGAEGLANWLESRTQAETMALLNAARKAITEGVAHVTRETAASAPVLNRRADTMAPAVAVLRDETGTPTEFVGPRVVLAYPQETERFEVIPEPGQKILSYAIMPAEGFDSLGFVELLVENGRPVSLLDIEVNAYGRQLGTGSAVIETLLAADPHAELHISNIVESARGFWSRMGVPEQNRAPGEAYDGILNWQTYAEAQDARTAPGVGRRTAARLAAEPDRGGQGPDRGGAGNPQGDGRGASDLPALSRQPEPGWLMPGRSRWDNYRYKLQDKQIDLKRARDAIAASRELDDQVDAYLQEELFHGRAAKRTEDFINHELDPLLKDAKARGLTLESIDEYLHARHAKEANALIAERDPEMQDGGSGLTNEEAAAYLSGLDDKRRADLEAVAAKVDAIISRTRAMMVNYQLEGQATVDGWAAMFKHYVPLMREDHEMGAGLGTGQGFSIKGRESKHRTGSTSKVIDILANIAMQRERTIVRGEKNRVAVALAGLAVINPNPEVWSFGPITERKYNERTGLVQVQIKGGWKNADNVLVAKIADEDGIVHERGIVFNERNERALRMAQALKNLDAAQLEGWMGAAAKATRWLASVNTQYNPIFGVVNLTRDVQGAALNLSTTAIKGKEAEVLKLTLPALAGVYRDTRATRKDKAPTSQWSQLWEEFQREGGQTGFRAMFQTSSDRADAIRASLDPQAWMRSGLGRVVTANGALSLPAGWMQKGGDWVFDWLSDYNLAMENGVRLAAYKVALDAGMSKQRAASLAKNLTVNFNRKGQVAQQAGALYAFFNASVQGTARLAETLTGPTGRKIIAGGVLLGALQALALMAAGYDDDEPPQFVRERNLIIPLDWVNKAGGPNLSRKYVTIPMPLGFHVLVNMGRIPVEYAASGFKNGGKRTMQVLGMLADSFNPIGNAGLSWQTVTPTAADPVVALLENRDGSGRPIARQAHNQITPGHALARDTASSWSKWMSRVINTMTGGSEYRAGFVSPTPDQIDYLIGQVTGGVGRELTKAEQFASSLVTGEELPPHKIPLLGRFYGDLNATSAEASRYYDNQLRMNSHEAEIKGITRDFNDGSKNKTLTEEGARLVKEYIKKNPEADPDLIEQSNKAERAIAKLRKDKRAAIARGDKKEVKQIEAETLGEMKSFNLLIKNADKIAATPLERQPE